MITEHNKAVSAIDTEIKKSNKKILDNEELMDAFSKTVEERYSEFQELHSDVQSLHEQVELIQAEM